MIRGALIAVTAKWPGPVTGSISPLLSPSAASAPACFWLALTQVDRFELATPFGGVGLLIGWAELGT
jgi:hypothetical protein